MFVEYEHEGHSTYRIINCFVKISDCDCDDFCGERCNARNFAIIKKLQVIQPFSVPFAVNNISMFFINRCLGISDDILAIDLHYLSCVYLYIQIDREIIYIFEPVNMLEFD